LKYDAGRILIVPWSRDFISRTITVNINGSVFAIKVTEEPCLEVSSYWLNGPGGRFLQIVIQFPP